MSREVNFDGLPGPTHNFSGLSYGNLASMSHKDRISNPKEAAIQSLEKMRFLGSLGYIQGIFPPHERPNLPTLRALGFSGNDSQILAQAFKHAPEIFFSCCSSSNMWAANAATVTPAIDSEEGRTQLTAANLVSGFHRSIEPATTTKILKAIFKDPLYFTVHEPLPAHQNFSDEGAANHTRFCRQYGEPGIHLFVYGRYSSRVNAIAPSRYPARQCAEASQAIARKHQIFRDRLVFAQQDPRAIDLGVFHNDVISVGNQNLFFCHESAFINTGNVIETLREKVESICNTELITLVVPKNLISVEEAVKTYLFNSQILTENSGFMTLIAPLECKHSAGIQDFLGEMVQDKGNPIKEVHYLNIRESMQNGGGPACLRLRLDLSEQEIEAVNPHTLLSEQLYIKLMSWVQKHYRDRLTPKDLADKELYEEVKIALDELTKILKLGPIYAFQTERT